MWELIETLSLFLYKKKIAVIPIVIIGLLCCLVTSFHIPPSQTSQKIVPTVQPTPVYSEIQKSSPSLANPSLAKKMDIPKEEAMHKNKEVGGSEERVSNGESIQNFTQFNDLLRDSLMEQYGEVLSRSLAHRIAQNLSSGHTDLESLEKSIAEELGANASQVTRDEVKKKVLDVVASIAMAPVK